jgi:hypothetical protein
VPTISQNVSSHSPHIPAASQVLLSKATIAMEDQSVFNVVQKLLQAYILSENPWLTMEEPKLLSLKAWNNALDYRRNGIALQGQDRRMLMEQTVPDKNIIKSVFISSEKLAMILYNTNLP